jgi:hypothetical protein
MVVLVAGLFASCTTDPYTPGEVPAGPQVCFSNQNATLLEVAGEGDGDIQQILLTRIVADAALDVYVIADAGENASMFSIPDKVTFAAGEKEAYLTIDVNSAKMEEDKEYAVSLLLADEKQGTPYGDSSFTVKFKLFPWEVVKTDDVETGKFRGGDVLTGLFDVESIDAEIDVKIYKHKSKVGMYMIQDPWAKVIVPTLGIESVEAIEDAGFKHTAANLVINCVNPTKCYIEKQNTGLTYSSYGDMMVASDYHPESNPTGLAGTLEEGVLTFPAGAVLVGLAKLEGGTLFESNLNGGFRAVLPGCTAVDYTLAVDYLGFEISPDMKSIIAKFDISFGSDVAGLKYYFAEGNVLTDPANAIDALINGTATDIREVENFTQGGKTMTLNTTIENGGLYTIVLAAVAADGSLVKKTVALDSFYYSGLGDTGSHPCEFDILVGNYTDYNTAEEGQEIGNYNALGFNVKGKDLKELYVGCWTTAELTEYLATAGNTLEKLVKESGLVSYTLAELIEVHSAAGKNGSLDGLIAETEYTVIVYAVNDYEESAVKTATFTTGKAPVYTGDFGVGKYLWKYEKGSTVYESTLEVQSYQGSSTRFIVTGLGIEDGSQWYATYDEEAGTLTLDGKVRGREKEGNLFGVEFGKLDADTVYQYASIAKTGTAGYRNDSFIFNVDKDTKKLVGHDNSTLTIYTQKSGKTSVYAKFDTTTSTTITPVE